MSSLPIQTENFIYLKLDYLILKSKLPHLFLLYTLTLLWYPSEPPKSMFIYVESSQSQLVEEDPFLTLGLCLYSLIFPLCPIIRADSRFSSRLWIDSLISLDKIDEISIFFDKFLKVFYNSESTDLYKNFIKGLSKISKKKSRTLVLS